MAAMSLTLCRLSAFGSTSLMPDRARQRPGGRPEMLSNSEIDRKDFGYPVGTTAAAALRRLRKDRPDIHARVLAGELSAHAGMPWFGPGIDAGRWH